MILARWYLVVDIFSGLIPFLVIAAVVGAFSLILRFLDRK